MRASVFVATSLDGFIARANGDLDWLPGGDGSTASIAAEAAEFHAFLETVDVVVMGRHTFEAVLALGKWPYAGKRVVVLTRGRLAVPAGLGTAVEAMGGPPAEVASRLAAEGARHLYVDGGRTIQGFLAAGLVQRLVLTRVPVLIGSGVPLFGPLPRDVALRHVGTRVFPSGLVRSEYEVEPS